MHIRQSINHRHQRRFLCHCKKLFSMQQKISRKRKTMKIKVRHLLDETNKMILIAFLYLLRLFLFVSCIQRCKWIASSINHCAFHWQVKRETEKKFALFFYSIIKNVNESSSAMTKRPQPVRQQRSTATTKKTHEMQYGELVIRQKPKEKKTRRRKWKKKSLFMVTNWLTKINT